MPTARHSQKIAACAIDFGTSNSAIAAPMQDGRMALVPVEDGAPTMPTAIFYLAEGADLHQLPRLFGRAAVAAYMEGTDGRLMRSIKSVLGSGLMDQHTDIGAGRSVSFADVIAGYLRQLKERAEAACGLSLTQVVLGRPVYFVDGDPSRDAQAQAALEAAARSVGFADIAFQFEPIAAALHHEATVDREERVLVADIGGGTSDFSLVRVGPDRRLRRDRRCDVLASHGVHIAGTDFDRRVELGAILPLLGYGSFGPTQGGLPAREVPSSVYFDLATWHLINTLQRPQRLAEVRALRVNFADPALHRRLLKVVEEHLGHDLLGRAERAKIQVADGGEANIDLSWVERGLSARVTHAEAAGWLNDDLRRIVAAAEETVTQAGLTSGQVNTLFFTGGSTGLRGLTSALCAAFPAARPVFGDRLASVASGLGLYAERWFATTR